MDQEILQLLIGGAIGIFGTIVGALINYQLTIRRDRFLMQEEKNKEIRQRLVEDAFKVAEVHGRKKIPFDGGGALYFPGQHEIDVEKQSHKLEALLKVVKASGKKNREVNEIMEDFLSGLEKYINNNVA